MTTDAAVSNADCHAASKAIDRQELLMTAHVAVSSIRPTQPLQLHSLCWYDSTAAVIHDSRSKKVSHLIETFFHPFFGEVPFGKKVSIESIN